MRAISVRGERQAPGWDLGVRWAVATAGAGLLTTVLSLASGQFLFGSWVFALAFGPMCAGAQFLALYRCIRGTGVRRWMLAGFGAGVLLFLVVEYSPLSFLAAFLLANVESRTLRTALSLSVIGLQFGAVFSTIQGRMLLGTASPQGGWWRALRPWVLANAVAWAVAPLIGIAYLQLGGYYPLANDRLLASDNADLWPRTVEGLIFAATLGLAVTGAVAGWGLVRMLVRPLAPVDHT